MRLLARTTRARRQCKWVATDSDAATSDVSQNAPLERSTKKRPTHPPTVRRWMSPANGVSSGGWFSVCRSLSFLVEGALGASLVMLSLGFWIEFRQKLNEDEKIKDNSLARTMFIAGGMMLIVSIVLTLTL